jgi:hypothetical protein
MELVFRAIELLDTIEYLNIATSSESNEPWNTPVYAASDSSLNFYWSSWKDAQHSINIRTQPSIFITLYDSTRKRGDNNRRCLYIQAVATELAELDEITLGAQLLYPMESTTINFQDFTGEGLRRIYRASPSAVWLNDISERQVSTQNTKMRIEVDLAELIKLRSSNK